MNRLKWSALLEGMNWSIALTSTRVMLFASFIVHVFIGGHLDAETVFVTLSLFNTISHPLTGELPHAVGLMGECFVTTKRIQEILELPEKGTVISSGTTKKGSVVFSKFHAKWNSVSVCSSLYLCPILSFYFLSSFSLSVTSCVICTNGTISVIAL